VVALILGAKCLYSFNYPDPLQIIGHGDSSIKILEPRELQLETNLVVLILDVLFLRRII
jgi:hypothetical protein